MLTIFEGVSAVPFATVAPYLQHLLPHAVSSELSPWSCQMRAFCLEYGVAMRHRAGIFKLDLPRLVADECNDMTSEQCGASSLSFSRT